MYLRFGKRAFDIVSTLVALVILLPLMLIVSLLIVLADPGPVLFVQDRVGKGGHLFQFYKFRSMPVDIGDVPSDQIGELRLSWVGRVIRRTNIDELPQLFNVLAGDMSIVGPRPPIPVQEDLLQLRRQNGSFSCRPGLTGLAQVNSFDGMSVEEKANFDGQYACKITFLRDLSIVMKTFLYLFRKPPVY